MTEKYARLIEKIIGEPVEFSFLAKKGYFSLTDDTLTYIKGTYQSTTIELRLCKNTLPTMIARFSLTEMPGC